MNSSLPLCLATLGALVPLLSCHERAGIHTEEDHEELATYMGRLQVYSQKLGYSVQANNAALSRFYLREVEEVMEEIVTAVPTHDGVDVAMLMEQMMMSTASKLEKALDGGDWARTQSHYKGLIARCNACHQAASHGFIRILPVSGTAPFNQSFQLSSPAKPK